MREEVKKVKVGQRGIRGKRIRNGFGFFANENCDGMVAVVGANGSCFWGLAAEREWREVDGGGDMMRITVNKKYGCCVFYICAEIFSLLIIISG